MRGCQANSSSNDKFHTFSLRLFLSVSQASPNTPGICFEACICFQPFKHQSISSEQKKLVLSAVDSLDSSDWVILRRWFCYGYVVMSEWGILTWLAIVFFLGAPPLPLHVTQALKVVLFILDNSSLQSLTVPNVN